MLPGLARTWPRSTSSFFVPRNRAPMLSPACPSSKILRNISTPVHTVFCVVRKPTISKSSPVCTLPCSTLPVTTVPRPVIVNTSSIGIKNGLSNSRTGSGIDASQASINSMILACHSSSPSRAFNDNTPPPHFLALPLLVTIESLQRRHPHHRGIVTRELVLGQQLTNLQLDQLEQ